MPVDGFYTLFSKLESVYKTDAVPVAATDAVLCRNFKASPVSVDTIDRKLDKPTRGAQPVLVTNARRNISFEIEMAGSGTAGTAPAWMDQNQACGMAAPTIAAGVSATQKFAAISTAIASLTNYHFVGDQRRKGLGARGDLSTISMVAGELPFFGYDFTELLPTATPFDTTAPGAPVYTKWKAPVEVNSVNTVFTLDGYAAVLRSMVLQSNAEIKVRNLVGANYVQRGNHAMRGKILIELPTTATKNYFTSLLANTQVAMQIIHGLVAGNIIQLDAGFLQILGVDDASEDDIAMLSLDVQLNTSVGQDDFLITAK